MFLVFLSNMLIIIPTILEVQISEGVTLFMTLAFFVSYVEDFMTFEVSFNVCLSFDVCFCVCL